MYTSNLASTHNVAKKYFTVIKNPSHDLREQESDWRAKTHFLAIKLTVHKFVCYKRSNPLD